MLITTLDEQVTKPKCPMCEDFCSRKSLTFFNLLTFIAIFIYIICTNQRLAVRANRCLADLLYLQLATNPESLETKGKINVCMEIMLKTFQFKHNVKDDQIIR
jgi:hypothetical protein